MSGAGSHQYGSTPIGTATHTLSGLADDEDNVGNIGLSGTAAYGQMPTSATSAGSFTIGYTGGGGLSSSAGYGFATGTGASYTVTKAPLTVTANNATKTYGQSGVFTGAEFSASGLRSGETIGSVTLASAGAASTATVTGGPLSGPYGRAHRSCRSRRHYVQSCHG